MSAGCPAGSPVAKTVRAALRPEAASARDTLTSDRQTRKATASIAARAARKFPRLGMCLALTYIREPYPTSFLLSGHPDGEGCSHG